MEIYCVVAEHWLSVRLGTAWGSSSRMSPIPDSMPQSTVISYPQVIQHLSVSPESSDKAQSESSLLWCSSIGLKHDSWLPACRDQLRLWGSLLYTYIYSSVLVHTHIYWDTFIYSYKLWYTDIYYFNEVYTRIYYILVCTLHICVYTTEYLTQGLSLGLSLRLFPGTFPGTCTFLEI